jgi:hypothetical protein
VHVFSCASDRVVVWLGGGDEVPGAAVEVAAEVADAGLVTAGTVLAGRLGGVLVGRTELAPSVAALLVEPVVQPASTRSSAAQAAGRIT